MKDVFDLLGRICLSSIFLVKAAQTIFILPDTTLKLVNEGLESSTAEFWQIAGMVLMILGGILVLLGYRSKLGAILLITYMIPTAIYHLDLSDLQKYLVLMQDVAIIGGLLMVLSHGSGKYSVRKLLASTKS